MKHILVLGAGKSATVLISYLIENASNENWHIHVADKNAELAKSKAGNTSFASAYGIDMDNDKQVDALIKKSNLVISLLPPTLHVMIAGKCLKYQKHFLNASYISADIQKLDADARSKNLVFLCEMGLDPGIDHMSAMEIIDGIKKDGGTIISFRSHCGGLVAPESDDNPWHYKISWNPRNIVLAGKDGALFKENGEEKKLGYAELFSSERTVEVPSLGPLAWYPNRDSLAYITKYHLEDVQTFVRTTLRHPDFSFGWKNLVDLKLTDEKVQYDTDGMTLASFFQIHFDRYGFSDWLQETLSARFTKTKELLEGLLKLIEAEKDAEPEELEAMQEFMMIDEKGRLQDMNLDTVKTNAASNMAFQMHEANLSLKQLFFLGLDSDELINKGQCSAADVLQFALEKKLALQPEDHDMIVMLHEIEYRFNEKKSTVKSQLIVKGEDRLRTAMAKTVGLPLGIAAKLILQGKIANPGVQIPVIPEIYEPVLKELKEEGILFSEMHEL